MGLIHGITPIVKNGLLTYLDAANSKSYPGSGSTWFDLSGNERHFSLINSPTYDSVSGSFFLNGTNQYAIDDDGESYINGLSATSINIWLKASSIGNDDGVVWSRPVGTSGDRGFGFRYDSSGFNGGGTNIIKAGFGDADSDEFSTESSNNVQTTEWQNLTITWEYPNAPMIYVNSVLDTPTAERTGSVSSIEDTENVIIGAGNTQYWGGNIASFSIYNRALTQNEITQNFNVVRGRFNL